MTKIKNIKDINDYNEIFETLTIWWGFFIDNRLFITYHSFNII